MATIGERLEGTDAATRARVLIVDPARLTVTWASDGSDIGMPLADAFALADGLGVPAAIAQVAETGERQRLVASVVATTRGQATVEVGVHRLPDGSVLLLVEHGFTPAAPRAADAHRRRRPR